MFRVLFKIGSLPVDTYYVIWLVALSLALRWIVARLPFYGIDEDDGRRVIAWGFLGMLFGSCAAYYVGNFADYWNNPSLFFDLNKGGLSEKGAVCGGLIVTLFLCRRDSKVPFFRLCEAVTPPAFFALALGRWGCFSAGCCVGVESALPWALHFPYDRALVTRHPTQIYYSLFSGVFLLLLLLLERKTRGPKKKEGGEAFREETLRGQAPFRPLLTPLGLLFYALMRTSVDPLRLNFLGKLPASDYVLLALMPFAIVWFLISWRAWKASN
jgi:phosphatidylglycerol:prolipoprotein diacylglycerol transferase